MKNIRRANPKDNESLHLLTESLPMEGDFSLRIERKPDFFALLQIRGDSETYLVSHHEKIEGSITVSKKEYLIKGKAHPSAIISDVKFLNMRNTTNFARLLQFTYEKIKQDNQLNSLFVTIAEGNTKIEGVLSGRVGLPKFHRIANFDILQLLSKKKTFDHPNIHKADLNISEGILEYYKSYLQNYDLANSPVAIDLDTEEEYYYKEGDKIVAAIRLMDTRHLKQNVLLRAPMSINLALSILRILKKPLGLPKIPKVGMPIDMLYIRYYACEEGAVESLMKLIEFARHRTYQKNLTFLSIAISEHINILKPIKKKFFHLTFKSSLYQAPLKSQPLKKEEKLLCFEDYAVV